MRPKTTIFAAAFATGLVATPAFAIDIAERVDVAVSVDQAWGAIAEFCSIKDWHPVVAECEQFEKDGVTMRRLVTGDGGEILEELNEMNDAGRSYTYSIIDSPLPVADYVSTMTVTGNGDGATIEWSSNFNANGAGDDEAIEVMTGIYRAGLDELKSRLSP